MIRKILYFVFILSFFLAISSCKVKRKEYIERKGLHSDQKPSEMTKELGKMSKKQKKEYSKQLRRTNKAIAKRNRQKLKGNYYE